MTGPTESEVRPDSDAAEEFAEAVGPDPTQDEIEHYRRLEGEPTAEEELDAAAESPDDDGPDPSVS